MVFKTIIAHKVLGPRILHLPTVIMGAVDSSTEYNRLARACFSSVTMVMQYLLPGSKISATL